MSPRKSERILNLAICLLMARRFIEKSQIRQIVEGYHDLSDVAFERTFERDKDELRAMGVAVETGSNNPLFPDDVGYRIRRDDFELPPIEFSAAEAAALGLAASVWESATQADQTVSALAKLRAAGIDPDPSRVAALAPSIGAKEPAFAAIWEATLVRMPIRFSYRGAQRRVEPWAMTYRNGAWYLHGRDRDKGAPRMFKIARVEGQAVKEGRPGSYQVPEVDLDAAWARIGSGPQDLEAVLAIRAGRGGQLRRNATALPGEAAPEGYQAMAVRYARRPELVAEICAHGADVLVLRPLALRRAVISQLKAVVGRSA